MLALQFWRSGSKDGKPLTLFPANAQEGHKQRTGGASQKGVLVEKGGGCAERGGGVPLTLFQANAH